MATEFKLSAVLEMKDRLTGGVKNARRFMDELNTAADGTAKSLQKVGDVGISALSGLEKAAVSAASGLQKAGKGGVSAISGMEKSAVAAASGLKDIEKSGVSAMGGLSKAADTAGRKVSDIKKAVSYIPKFTGMDVVLRDRVTPKLDGLRSKLNDVSGKSYNVLVNMKNAGAGAVNNLKSSIGNMASGAVPQAMGLMGVGMGIADTVNTFKDFQAQMSTVQAISGSSGESLARLTAKAKEMGATTQFSATEAGKAMEYMAMAGWNDRQMLDGISGVMNLAGASGEDLGRVSDIVTDALSAFGMQAEQSGHFADVLAAATSKSNTSVGLMGETFKYVAPVAGAMKYSIEDTALAIGLMANSGIKGSEAGTALRSTLTRLVKPPKEAAAALDQLGIKAANADGTMKPLRQTMVELRAKFKGLTDEQKSQLAASIAGQEAMSGFLAIMNESDANFMNLAKAVDTSNGKALEMNKVKNDNLAGDIKSLQSAWESLQLAIMEGGKGGGPATGLRGFVNGIKEDVDLLKKSLEDGLDISDVGRLSLNIVSQLYDKFKALDGIGSLLAGGALAAGLYKIVSLSQKAVGALNGMGKGTGGIGNKSGLPELPGSIGQMTVNAANVIVNNRGVPGKEPVDMPGTGVPGTPGSPKPGTPKKPGGFKGAAKGLLKGVSRWAIPLELAAMGLGYYSTSQENEQTSWGAGYQLSEAKKQAAASTDALLEAKSHGASEDEISFLQKQHQEAVASMSRAQQYSDETDKYNANRMNGVIGSGIGGVAGGVIGGAIGSVIAPGVGTMAGAAIGGALGSSAGEFVGMNFNEWTETASQSLAEFKANFDASTAEMGSSFRQAFADFGTVVDESMQYVSDGVSNNFEYVANGVSNNFEYLKGRAADAGAGISQFMTEAGTNIQTAFQSMKNSVNNGWEDIKTGAGSLADSLSTAFDSAIATVKGKFQDLSAYASSALASARSTAGSAWDSVKSTGSNAYNYVFGGPGSYATGTSYFRAADTVPAFASGIDFFREGGLAQINEHGGELVELPTGSRVFPTAETQQIINRSLQNGDLLGGMFSLPDLSSLSAASDNSSKGNSNPVINITGNNFTVREEADIEKIAHAMMEQVLLALGNYAGC